MLDRASRLLWQETDKVKKLWLVVISRDCATLHGNSCVCVLSAFDQVKTFRSAVLNVQVAKVKNPEIVILRPLEYVSHRSASLRTGTSNSASRLSGSAMNSTDCRR